MVEEKGFKKGVVFSWFLGRAHCGQLKTETHIINVAFS